MDAETGREAVPRVVVGVALVRNGRVLAARRTVPASAAGGWELPGGKVEPGESEQEAARREIAEELGCEVVVGDRVGGEVVLPGGLVLRVRAARLVAGEPVATEHDLLRWLLPGEMDSVGWLDADRPFLPAVAELLGADAPEAQEAHFDEGDDAEDVAETLRAEGHAADVRRESFAGEDDSEDRAWLVRVTTAEAAARLRELVADVELAWVEETAPVRPTAPPPLPSGPKRLKRD